MDKGLQKYILLMAGTMLPFAKGMNIIMCAISVMMAMLLFTIKCIDDKADYNAANEFEQKNFKYCCHFDF